MKLTRQNGNGMTIEMAKNDFIYAKKTEGLSKRTIESYEYAIEYLCNNLCINIHNDVSEINKERWLEFISGMQNRDMGKNSINHFITSCRVFLYWCMENDYIEPFKIKLIKGQEPPIKLYSDEEMEKLMAKPPKNCSFTEYRQWVMVVFIMSTGARANTVLNVSIEDLDINNNSVTYNQLKNKKSAIIPIPPKTMQIIKEYIHIWGLDEYLFPTEENKQMRLDGVETAFKRYCIRRGVANKGLHTLRHTFCSSLVKQNVNPFIIQKIMTHSSIAVTEKYVHLFSNDLDEVTEVVPVNRYLKESKRIHRQQIHIYNV